MQETFGGPWQLSFGEAKAGTYASPEGAVAAIALAKARIPASVSANGWKVPSDLAGWHLELV